MSHVIQLTRGYDVLEEPCFGGVMSEGPRTSTK